MKKLVVLIAMVGSMFANEVVVEKVTQKFLTALKTMDKQEITQLLTPTALKRVNSVDNHIVYFRDINIVDIRQKNEFGNYQVILDNQEFNHLSVKRDDTGIYKVVGL